MVKIDIRKSDKCNGEWGAFISFPYNTELVSLIRSFPSRYWNGDTKEWEIPFTKMWDFIEGSKTHEIDISSSDGTVFQVKEENVCMPQNFAFKTKPFEHQIDGFNYGLSHSQWLLGDEQGLGKTKQVIDIAVAKKETMGYTHCLIICGVNGLKWNWQNEILVHSNETGWILGQRKGIGTKIKIGSTKDKLYDLQNLPEDYFLITNVESLRDESIANEISKLCKDGTIGMVAIDEIHKCKNHSSQQGKGILKVQPECRIAMTGTPLMNRPMDLYIILKWLGFEKHPYYAFEKHYCIKGGYGGYEVVGYKNLDELQEQLNSIMLRRLKNDVLDLPEKLYINEYVEMSSKQAQLYKEIRMDIMANIDQVKATSNPLSQMIRLRQATGYTGILSSDIKESAKLDRLEELVIESIENDKKVVIFSNWTQMTDAIEKRLIDYCPLVITGETKDEERQARVNAFQHDKNAKIMIGTIGAMGTGLTLTEGSVVIFADHPWNRALYDQAVDRCHRIGQKKNITIYNLLCKDTIDERVWTLVTEKGAMSDAIVDGKVLENRSDLVDYLLG